MAAGALLAAVEVFGVVPAFANAPNPNPDTTGTSTLNADGSVTANLSGTWIWSDQNCEGRYGEGWAVDWWGISSSPTPSPSFSLTNASEVISAGNNATGTISPAGSIKINGTNNYFHVAQYYAGEDVNSSATCTDTGPNSSTGSWSATATYPSQADVPAQVCVILYDEHGSEAKPTGNGTGSDFDPTKDNDNSIQTNNFNPAGGGYCVALTPKTPVPVSGIVGAAGVALGAGIFLAGFQWRSRRRRLADATN
jgi:hypothetical protein